MTQLLIFLAIAIFVAVLMRKKRHKPNRNFFPNQLACHLAEIPIIKENLRGIIKNEKTTTNFINDIGANHLVKC